MRAERKRFSSWTERGRSASGVFMTIASKWLLSNGTFVPRTETSSVAGRSAEVSGFPSVRGSGAGGT